MPQNGGLEENGNVVESEEGNNSPKYVQRRVPALRSVVSEIMRLRADPGSMEPELERLIGGVINKEVELALAKQMHLCNKKWETGNERHLSESRSLQLQFLNKLSLPVLTGRKIGGEEYTSIRVALVDGLTGQVVTSGPEASAKVEIVALEKDFDGYEGDNWTLEEFNRKIVREREGKRPLLTGNVYLTLKEGIGFIGDVCFTHTKRWMTKREFRLGARIMDGSHGIRVREAKSELFTVEDRRGKLYQKHYPPTLSDAVWRLEKIGKDGAFHKRLSKENINTVEDFLTLLNINPQRLKEILGASMSAKVWDITVDHARTCIPDKGLQFIPVDKQSETEKDDAHKLVVSAFQHWEDLNPVDDESSLVGGSQQLANAVDPSKLTMLESPNGCNFETSDMTDLYGNTQQDSSYTDNISPGGTTIMDDFGLLGVEKLDYISGQPLCFQGKIPNSRICDPESVRQDINNEPLNFLTWNSGEEVLHTESRSLELRFSNNISIPVFSGIPIEGEDSTVLKIVLLDAFTGQVVYSGPASSAKVEIVVLEGDSDGDIDSGTLEEFKNNIIREREGKKPLLAGDTLLDLKEGIGMVGEISFTDDLSWTSGGRFKLGAMVVDNSDGIRVREAKTNSFIIRDPHGDVYKKHQPPSLNDEVWRLEEIGKDGVFHKLLSSKNVNTVKDFLTLLSVDSPRLQNILGTSLSAKMWKVMVDHARTCKLDQRVYFYCSPGSVQKTGVVFNVVGEVRGIISEHQYVSIDKLSETKKADALMLVISAFEHCENVIPIDDEASLLNGSLCLTNVLYPSNSVITESSDCNKILPSCNRSDNPQLGANSHDGLPSIYSTWDVNCLGNHNLQSIDYINRRYEQPLSFTSPVNTSLICDTESMIQAFCEDEHLQFSDNHCPLQSHHTILESQGDPQNAVNDIPLARPVAVTMNKAQRRYLSKRNAQRRWRMLFSIMRWFSVRRNVAGKTPSDEIHKDASSGGINTSIYSIEAVNDILLARSAAVAMNKAQRRYLSKRERAHRRWRMIFSIMRWFSVKRNVVRNTPVRERENNLSASSQDIVPSIYSIDGINGFNDAGLQIAGDMDRRYEQPLSFPGYVNKSLFGDKGSMTWAFCEDEHLQLLDAHSPVQSQNSELEPPGNLRSSVNNIPLARSAAVGMNRTQRRYLLKRNKAQRRWRMLFSVVRWFSVRRNVARKASVEEIPFKLSATSHDTISSICTMGNMRSLDNDGLQITLDTNSRHQQSMPGLVSKSVICDTECMTRGFCEDEHLQIFHTHCSLHSQNSNLESHCSLHSQNSNLESQANLHDTINDILLARSAMNKAQRRCSSKTNKAQRRWRMLFSVVRWFSVRRNVARKGHVIDVQRYS